MPTAAGYQCRRVVGVPRIKNQHEMLDEYFRVSYVQGSVFTKSIDLTSMNNSWMIMLTSLILTIAPFSYKHLSRRIFHAHIQQVQTQKESPMGQNK